MALRTYMTFEAPVQEAPSEDTPTGEALAGVLADGAARQGLRLTQPVDQFESYGWCFVLSGATDQSIWCLLQYSDNWLVITKAERPLLARLFGKPVDQGVHRAVCEALHVTALSRAEASGVRWFTEAEFRANQPGSDRP